MKLLLDTHLLIRAAGFPDRMPEKARELLDDGDNDFFFTAASLWEIAIKGSLRCDDFFVVDARLLRRGLLDNDYNELPVISEHAVAIDAAGNSQRPLRSHPGCAIDGRGHHSPHGR